MNLLRNRSYKASMLSTFVVAIMATFSFTASYQSGADLEVDWVLFPVFYWVTGVTCD